MVTEGFLPKAYEELQPGDGIKVRALLGAFVKSITQSGTDLTFTFQDATNAEQTLTVSLAHPFSATDEAKLDALNVRSLTSLGVNGATLTLTFEDGSGATRTRTVNLPGVSRGTSAAPEHEHEYDFEEITATIPSFVDVLDRTDTSGVGPSRMLGTGAEVQVNLADATNADLGLTVASNNMTFAEAGAYNIEIELTLQSQAVLLLTGAAVNVAAGGGRQWTDVYLKRTRNSVTSEIASSRETILLRQPHNVNTGASVGPTTYSAHLFELIEVEAGDVIGLYVEGQFAQANSNDPASATTSVIAQLRTQPTSQIVVSAIDAAENAFTEHQEEVFNAFEGDVWEVSGSANDCGFVGPVSSQYNNTVHTVVDPWQTSHAQGPHVTNYYIAVRIPVALKDHLSRYRIIGPSGEAGAAPDVPPIQLDAASGVRHLTDNDDLDGTGRYAYYEIQIPNIPAGTTLRAEIFDRFVFNRDRFQPIIEPEDLDADTEDEKAAFRTRLGVAASGAMGQSESVGVSALTPDALELLDPNRRVAPVGFIGDILYGGATYLAPVGDIANDLPARAAAVGQIGSVALPQVAAGGTNAEYGRVIDWPDSGASGFEVDGIPDIPDTNDRLTIFLMFYPDDLSAARKLITIPKTFSSQLDSGEIEVSVSTTGEVEIRSIKVGTGPFNAGRVASGSTRAIAGTWNYLAVQITRGTSANTFQYTLSLNGNLSGPSLEFTEDGLLPITAVRFGTDGSATTPRGQFANLFIVRSDAGRSPSLINAACSAVPGTIDRANLYANYIRIPFETIADRRRYAPNPNILAAAEDLPIANVRQAYLLDNNGIRLGDIRRIWLEVSLNGLGWAWAWIDGAWITARVLADAYADDGAQVWLQYHQFGLLQCGEGRPQDSGGNLWYVNFSRLAQDDEDVITSMHIHNQVRSHATNPRIRSIQVEYNS